MRTQQQFIIANSVKAFMEKKFQNVAKYVKGVFSLKLF